MPRAPDAQYVSRAPDAAHGMHTAPNTSPKFGDVFGAVCMPCACRVREKGPFDAE